MNSRLFIERHIHVLNGPVAEHQITDRIPGRLTFEENLVDALDDRHRYLILLRECTCRLRRIYTLDRLADLLHRFFVASTLAHQDTGAAVSAVHRRTGHDQITDTAQAVEGLHAAAHLHTESLDLRDTACDQRCP